MPNTEKERRQEQSNNAIKDNYRAKEASVYVGVHINTIWAYAKAGRLTPIRISPRITIFKRADLDRLTETA